MIQNPFIPNDWNMFKEAMAYFYDFEEGDTMDAMSEDEYSLIIDTYHNYAIPTAKDFARHCVYFLLNEAPSNDTTRTDICCFLFKSLILNASYLTKNAMKDLNKIDDLVPYADLHDEVMNAFHDLYANEDFDPGYYSPKAMDLLRIETLVTIRQDTKMNVLGNPHFYASEMLAVLQNLGTSSNNSLYRHTENVSNELLDLMCLHPKQENYPRRNIRKPNGP